MGGKISVTRNQLIELTFCKNKIIARLARRILKEMKKCEHEWVFDGPNMKKCLKCSCKRFEG